MSTPHHNNTLKARGLWSMKFPACTMCGTTEIRHYGNGLCLKCDAKQRKPERDRKYRIQHKRELATKKREYYERNIYIKKKQDEERRSRLRFDELDELALKRADYKCQNCGITNEENYKKYGSRLNIHHKENDGRAYINQGLPPINDLENLQVLCSRCHLNISRSTRRYTSEISRKAWKTRREMHGLNGLTSGGSSVEKNCIFCGRIFTSRGGIKKYCSAKCYHNARKM